MDAEPTRITWYTNERRNSIGSVNGLRLFVIEYSADPSLRETPYCMYTALPISKRQQEGWKYIDRNQAKLRAERILEQFVKKLGAVFPSNNQTAFK